MFTLLYHLQALKWAVPTVMMLGSAPVYFMTWFGWRAATAILPERLYNKGDASMYNFYQSLILFFFETFSGVELVMYGDAEDVFKKKENVIMICNHQSTVDWIIANMLAVRQGSMGYVRYILKDGLKYFPLYGLYFRQHSCIYVKRGGFQHEKAEQQLDQFATSDIPFWMVIFPEGTRINRKNLEKSKEFASSKGLPDLDYVLYPRYKATQLCIDHLRDITDAVYDVTAVYSGTVDKDSGQRVDAAGLTEFVQGDCKKLHLLVERIDMNDVPRGEEEIKNWLFQRYTRKDNILRKFYEQKGADVALSDNGRINRLSLSHTLPAFLAFTGVTALMLCTEKGRKLYWGTLVFGTLGSWGWMSIRS